MDDWVGREPCVVLAAFKLGDGCGLGEAATTSTLTLCINVICRPYRTCCGVRSFIRRIEIRR